MVSVERFPALDATGFFRSLFIPLIPGVDVKTDRDTALARLAEPHRSLLEQHGFHSARFFTAEQIHGRHVAIVDAASPAITPEADGLATATPGLCLGVYVADCAAVYLADPVRKAVALVHSGKKGTELDILGAAVTLLRHQFGSEPSDLVGAVSPCIRPPHYEVDFAATIARQAHDAGVRQFHDAATCTASHPERYYSYRCELGQTGRMLAAIEILP